MRCKDEDEEGKEVIEAYRDMGLQLWPTMAHDATNIWAMTHLPAVKPCSSRVIHALQLDNVCTAGLVPLGPAKSNESINAAATKCCEAAASHLAPCERHDDALDVESRRCLNLGGHFCRSKISVQARLKQETLYRSADERMRTCLCGVRMTGSKVCTPNIFCERSQYACLGVLNSQGQN
jgi:hypothetical protein